MSPCRVWNVMLHGRRQSSRGLSYLLGSAIAILLPLTAAAQIEPVAGLAGGKPSDTGFDDLIIHTQKGIQRWRSTSTLESCGMRRTRRSGM
jgi:hypothetical protein